MQLELGTDDDDRAARVVDALAEQVLTEPALLALEHVGQRLERTLATAANRLGATTVVEERVHRFLEHALLVPENDFRSAMRDQLLETVVPVDDATIEIVEIRRCETTAVERNERTEIRRNHRDHVENHPVRMIPLIAFVARITERVDDLEPLEQHLLPMLRRLGHHLRAQLLGRLVDVELPEQIANGRRADVGVESAVALLLRLLSEIQVFVFVQQLALFDLLLARLDDDVVGVIDDLLEITERDVEQIAHRARQRLEEPDVRHRHRELDVAHALAADLGERDFHAAAVTDDPAVADALVLAAMAFPVLDRTEDALAEEAVLLGLERPVVDRFGLG